MCKLHFLSMPLAAYHIMRRVSVLLSYCIHCVVAGLFRFTGIPLAEILYNPNALRQ